MKKNLLWLFMLLMPFLAAAQQNPYQHNFFDTNLNPIVEVVAGTNGIQVLYSTIGVDKRRFTVSYTNSASTAAASNLWYPVNADNVWIHTNSPTELTFSVTNVPTAGLSYYVKGTLTNQVQTTGSVTAASFTGSGSGLTNLPSTALSVKSFGAVGDGTANDYLACQRTLDIASTNPTVREVYFPPGTYLLTNTLVIGSGVTVRGSGAGSVLKKGTDYSHVFANRAAYSNGVVSDMYIRVVDLLINGNALGSQNGSARSTMRGQLNFAWIDGLALDNVTLTNGDTTLYGCQLVCVTNALITRYFVDSPKDGLDILSGCQNVTVQNSYFNTGDDAIAIMPYGYPSAMTTADDVEGIVIQNSRVQRKSGSGGNISFYIGSWTNWAVGNTYKIGHLAVNAGNIYKQVNNVTNVAANAPVHSSGDVEGADGLKWRFLQVGTKLTANVRRVLLQNIQTDTNSFINTRPLDPGYDHSVYPGTEMQAQLSDLVVQNVGPNPAVVNWLEDGVNGYALQFQATNNWRAGGQFGSLVVSNRNKDYIPFQVDTTAAAAALKVTSNGVVTVNNQSGVSSLIVQGNGHTIGLKSSTPYGEFFNNSDVRLGWWGYGLDADQLYIVNQVSGQPIKFATSGYTGVRLTLSDTAATFTGTITGNGAGLTNADGATSPYQFVTLAQQQAALAVYRAFYLWSGSNSTVNTNAKAMRTLDYGNPPLGTNTVTVYSNNQYIVYCSPAAGLTELKAGTYQVTADIWQSAVGADAVSLAAEIYVFHPGTYTETEITPVAGTSSQVITGSKLQYIFTLTVSTNVDIAATDSIELKFKSSGVAGAPVTLYIESGAMQVPTPASQYPLLAGNNYWTGSNNFSGALKGNTIALSGSNNTITASALGTAYVPVLTLTNSSIGATGAMQNSPALMLAGNGFRTQYGTNVSVQMGLSTVPVQGTTSDPSGRLTVFKSIAGVDPSAVNFYITSSGVAVGSFQAGTSGYQWSGSGYTFSPLDGYIGMTKANAVDFSTLCLGGLETAAKAWQTTNWPALRVESATNNITLGIRAGTNAAAGVGYASLAASNVTHYGYADFYKLAFTNTPPTDMGRIFGADVGGTTEMFAEDEGGNVTQLSSHPLTAPADFYVVTNWTKGIPKISMSANRYTGTVEWSNESLMNLLRKLELRGTNIATLPAAIRARLVNAVHAEETFAEYNARLGYTNGHPLYLVKLVWADVQAARQAAYDAQRSVELNALAEWQALPDEQKTNTAQPWVRPARDIRKTIPALLQSVVSQ